MSGIKAKITRQRIPQFVRVGLILAPLLIGWMIQQQLSPTAARPRAMATTFNVAAGDAAGLIAAINAANNEAVNPGPDTIVLAGGTYTFSAADNLWYGPNVLPAIASAITIEGNGATLQIGGNPTRRRFFFIGANPAANSTRDFLTPGAGHLTLRNLTLKGGRQRGGDSHLGGGGAGLGGAIFNQGTLTLDGVTLTENRATGGNSLATNPAESTDTPSEGGGGLAGGASGSSRSGGMADSDSSISEASFPSGSQGGLVSPPGARTGSGGGGFSPTPRGDGLQGTFTVAGNGGGSRDGLGGDGGLGALPKGLSGYGSGGGARSGGVLDERINLITRRGNFGMGGLNSFPPFTILGGGGGGVGGGGGMGESGGGGGFGGGGGKGGIAGGNGGFGGGGAAATLGESHGGFGAGRGTGGGTAGTGGGGAGMGGAIFNHGGTLTAVNCTFTANHAQGGSSRFTDDANGSGFGGAIFNLNGSITLRFCTLANNTVAAGSAIEGVADGGAVYNLGYNLLTGQSAGVTLDHSILANSSNRGVVANDLVIHQPRNVSPATGGGANRATSFLVFVNKNLVMRRLLDNGSLSGPAPLTGDPLLGALQSNGGLTLTMLPQAGSPVINAGINANAPATDQRSILRPQGQFTDLGAVEVVPPPCPTITIQARP